MKIYTKTGDQGQTGLFAGPRVRKDDVRIEAYGSVDELNTVLGLARTQHPPADMDSLLERLQNELFCVGAELATPDPTALRMTLIDEPHIRALEQAIDHYEAGLTPLKQFILPGGTNVSATLHFARAVCRRAERRVVTLAHEPQAEISPGMIRYLNRLSDLLFVLARAANAAVGQADIAWQKPAGGP